MDIHVHVQLVTWAKHAVLISMIAHQILVNMAHVP